MIVISSKEWKLTEVGEQRFIFENVKDRTVNMTVQRCKYVLKEKNEVVLLSFDNGVPGMCFTQSTKSRIDPSKLSQTWQAWMDMFKRNRVINASRISEVMTS